MGHGRKRERARALAVLWLTGSGVSGVLYLEFRNTKYPLLETSRLPITITMQQEKEIQKTKNNQ
jgi:hypothetical protein